MSLPPVSPQQIQAARQGATPAWNALVRDWGPVVLGWCRYQGAPDPEDAAHEVFIRLYQRLDRLDEPQRFRAFLYGISKRVISEHRRRAWWRRWSGAPAPRLDPGPDPEHQLRLARAMRICLPAGSGWSTRPTRQLLEADEALRAGDWAGYGEAQERLRATLEQLGGLANGKAPSDTAPA